MLVKDYYTYRITWSEDDSEYLGLCLEFPGLSWLAESPEEALKGIRTVVAESVADLEKEGEPAPEPLSTKHFSGKFVVRIPPEQHRELAIKAAEAKVSINRLIASKISTG